jgi:transposase
VAGEGKVRDPERFGISNARTVSAVSPPEAPHQSAVLSKARDLPRVDDRRVISGIVYVVRNGLQWKDVPAGYSHTKPMQPLLRPLGLA